MSLKLGLMMPCYKISVENSRQGNCTTPVMATVSLWLRMMQPQHTCKQHIEQIEPNHSIIPQHYTKILILKLPIISQVTIANQSIAVYT